MFSVGLGALDHPPIPKRGAAAAHCSFRVKCRGQISGTSTSVEHQIRLALRLQKIQNAKCKGQIFTEMCLVRFDHMCYTVMAFSVITHLTTHTIVIWSSMPFCFQYYEYHHL